MFFQKYDLWARIILSVLFFPMFFQATFIKWTWGANDSFGIMMAKRLLLLLPVAAIIFACWITIVAIISIIIRQKRREFIGSIFITWWDLGRAIFNFWGGLAKFIFYFLGWLIAFIRLTLVGIWLSIQDILLSPLRAIKGVGENAFRPGVPWIAVWLTLGWCALEALIFTFVMTSLVVDTLSGITGVELNEVAVQIVLYFFLLAIAIGSYSVLGALETAIKHRKINEIIMVFFVEIISLFVEVTFLYREFVDALVPWFAQHAGEDFQMGIFSILLLSVLIWAGIRGMTWFLFAGSGTPTILAIIKRTGVSDGKSNLTQIRKSEHFAFIKAAVGHIMNDIDWVHEKTDELFSSFVLPPLQIFAACINFCTLLITSKHLFDLPFTSYKELKEAKDLMKKFN